MAGCADEEETALETLKGYEVELDWLLRVLEGSDNAGSSSTNFGPDDFPGEYDSYCDAAGDGNTVSEAQPGYFTNLMTAQEAEPPQANNDASATLNTDPGTGLAETASVSGPTSSSASTATQAGEQKSTGRGKKRAQSLPEPGSRRPRKQAKEGQARNPVGRPRVDPAKTYFRHLKRYSSGGLFSNDEEAPAAPVESAKKA